MAHSFYFYDLETSGINARTSRIMQFAGQRTDMNLVPIAEPDNILIRLTDDVLPEPDAIMVTGITPQKTRSEGITEAEFLRYFAGKISLPDTIFTGFNNVRFDDEFLRFTQYRNFYDAYEWCWRDGRGRWDLLDVVRMTRALRPDGIEWPVGTDGKPSNRLELLTALNKLEHTDAHDALSDVRATIAVARLIRNKQPKLFDFLLEYRDKKKVEALVRKGEPFVYTSGKYPSLYEKTSVVMQLGDHPGKQGALVYDLRRDPEEIAGMTAAQLAKAWMERVEDETKRFPVKTLQFNRCPAVAPQNVLRAEDCERLRLDMTAVRQHAQKLAALPDLYTKLIEALKIMDRQYQTGLVADEQAVDAQLYDGFISDQDKTVMSVVRAAEADEITGLDVTFKDERLNKLLPLYKARNFPQQLTDEERAAWEAFRSQRLLAGGQSSLAARFFKRLGELAEAPGLSGEKRYLLEELQLYGESILPTPDM